MKHHIRDFAIEITRKCNMFCDHCCRGDAQNMEITREIIEKTFENIESIGSLIITGGEPSLNIKAINDIIGVSKEKNVSIGRFYLVTNAKIVTDEFIMSLLRLQLTCEEQDIEEYGNSVEISCDLNHSEVEDDNINKLLMLRFAGKRNHNFHYGYYDNDSIIMEGRGAENYNSNRELSYGEIPIYDDQIENEEPLYLNCKGNILPLCDMSYESQDKPDHIIGNVLEPDFDFLKAIENYNERLESKRVIA